MTNQLATSSVTSQLSGQPGRAIVSARGHHFVVDSPGPLGGPNEEINPIDVFLAALATCGTFICETVAQEMGIPLQAARVTVAGDFDPRGVCGEAVDPRIRAFRVRLALSGPDEQQGQRLAKAFEQRCPVYTTLARSAPIEIEVTVADRAANGNQEQKMKELRCRDIGFDCDAVVKAESEDEILRQAAAHARADHGVKVTTEFAEQAQAAIKEVGEQER